MGTEYGDKPKTSTKKGDRPPQRGGFFALFNALYDAGHLAGLKATEIKVLWAFLRHADADGVAFPGPESIAKNIGVSERNVYRALRGLAAKGTVVTLDAGGGRNNVAKRRVVLPETLAQGVRVSDDGNPDKSASKTLAQGGKKHWRKSSKNPDSLRQTNSTENNSMKDTATAAAAPPDAAAASLLILLKKEGIDRRTAEHLVTFGEQRVRDAIASADFKSQRRTLKSRGGYIRKFLEEEWELPAELQRKRKIGEALSNLPEGSRRLGAEQKGQYPEDNYRIPEFRPGQRSENGFQRADITADVLKAGFPEMEDGDAEWGAFVANASEQELNDWREALKLNMPDRAEFYASVDMWKWRPVGESVLRLKKHGFPTGQAYIEHMAKVAERKQREAEASQKQRAEKDRELAEIQAFIDGIAEADLGSLMTAFYGRYPTLQRLHPNGPRKDPILAHAVFAFAKTQTVEAA